MNCAKATSPLGPASPFGVDEATEWAMNAYLDLRSNEQHRAGDAVHRAMRAEWDSAEERPSLLWWARFGALSFTGMMMLGWIYLVIGEGLRALGGYSDWLLLALVFGPIIAGGVGWSWFQNWRQRYRDRIIREAFDAEARAWRPESPS